MNRSKIQNSWHSTRCIIFIRLGFLNMHEAGPSRPKTIYKPEQVGSPQSLLSDIIPSQMYTLTNIINKIKRHEGNIFFIVVTNPFSPHHHYHSATSLTHSRGDIWYIWYLWYVFFASFDFLCLASLFHVSDVSY